MNTTMFEKDRGFDKIEDAYKAGYEVIIDREELNVQMKLERKEELVKERTEKLNKERLTNNVLVLYIDALSRRHAHRKLPKTLEWFA